MNTETAHEIAEELDQLGYIDSTHLSQREPWRILDEIATLIVKKAAKQSDHLRAALENIASQRLRSEIEPIDGEVTGDFEGAYDTMINVARDALVAPASTAALRDEAERPALAKAAGDEVWLLVRKYHDEFNVIPSASDIAAIIGRCLAGGE